MNNLSKLFPHIIIFTNFAKDSALFAHKLKQEIT